MAGCLVSLAAFAAMLLADQGASVVKVEPLGFGDVTQ